MAESAASVQAIADIVAWLANDGIHQEVESVEVGVMRADVATAAGTQEARIEYMRHAMLNGPGSAGPFFLRPIGAHTIPVLELEWNLEADPPTLKLRVTLYFPGATGEPELLAVGYRYETPEGNPSSDHHMHHVQPIKALTRASGPRLKGAWEHTPDRHPTLPLQASDALGLLACLVVSLYGKRFVRRTLQPDVGDTLTASLERMH